MSPDRALIDAWLTTHSPKICPPAVLCASEHIDEAKLDARPHRERAAHAHELAVQDAMKGWKYNKEQRKRAIKAARGGNRKNNKIGSKV